MWICDIFQNVFSWFPQLYIYANNFASLISFEVYVIIDLRWDVDCGTMVFIKISFSQFCSCLSAPIILCHWYRASSMWPLILNKFRIAECRFVTFPTCCLDISMIFFSAWTFLHRQSRIDVNMAIDLTITCGLCIFNFLCVKIITHCRSCGISNPNHRSMI